MICGGLIKRPEYDTTMITFAVTATIPLRMVLNSHELFDEAWLNSVRARRT